MKLTLIATITAALSLNAHALNLNGTLFEKSGHEYNIDPSLLYAIALAESAVRVEDTATVKPYPLAIRSDKPFYPENSAEAEITI